MESRPLAIKYMHKTFRNHLTHRQKDQAPKQSRVAMMPGFPPPCLLIFNLEVSFSLHPPCLQADVLLLTLPTFVQLVLLTSFSSLVFDSSFFVVAYFFNLHLLVCLSSRQTNSFERQDYNWLINLAAQNWNIDLSLCLLLLYVGILPCKHCGVWHLEEDMCCGLDRTIPGRLKVLGTFP